MVSRPPVDTGVALGTAGLLGLLLDDKGLQVIAVPFSPLPTIGPERRTHHIELMRRLGGDQEVGVPRAAVESVCPRQEIPIGQVLLDGGAHDAILRGRWRRHHLRDEIGVVGIAGLGEVERIADPVGLALTAVAGLQVVGRSDAHRGRRLLIPGAPAERFEPRHRTAVIVLEPYLPECLQGREVAEAQRGVGGLHPRQELLAVRADLPGERLARAGLFRQAGMVGPEVIAGIPVRRHVRLHPRGLRRTELIERIMGTVRRHR
jgi:hypothetical protein